MSPFSLPSSSAEAAHSATSVLELLEVLWGRGVESSAAPVSPSQLRLMFVLERDEGINLRTLAEILDSAPPSVSRLCDRLQAVGFLERSASPHSRRELELRLSAGGRAFLTELRGRREREVEAITAAMSPAARTALRTGLEAFRAAAAGAGRDVAGGRADDARTA